MINEIDKDTLNLLLAGILWTVVVGCAVGSIISQRLDPKARRFWLLVIILAPLVGMLAYLPFSLDNPKAIKDWFSKIFPSD